MAGQTSTQVVIHGRTYHLVGADPARTRALARKVDDTIRQFAGQMPGADRYGLSILAALHIAEELSVARDELEACQADMRDSATRIVKAIQAGLGEG